MFEDEKSRIVAALGIDPCYVQHVGSTSVPGLAAKPILDIMIGVSTDDGNQHQREEEHPSYPYHTGDYVAPHNDERLSIHVMPSTTDYEIYQ